MPAGGHQTDKGGLQFLIFYIVGADVAADMMDPHQRNPRGEADGFRLRHAHQKCAYQPRAVGDSDGIYVLQSCLGLDQRLFDDLINLLDMLPGSDFRHYAPVLGVQRNLGKNNIGQHLPAVFHHGSCCLITGSLNRKH